MKTAADLYASIATDFADHIARQQAHLDSNEMEIAELKDQRDKHNAAYSVLQKKYHALMAEATQYKDQLETSRTNAGWFRRAIEQSLTAAGAPLWHPETTAPARKPMMPQERIAWLKERVDEVQAKHLSDVEMLKRQISRTDVVSNTAKRVLQAVFDEVEGDSDGADDATPYAKLCNRIVGLLWNHVEHKDETTRKIERAIKDDDFMTAGTLLLHQTMMGPEPDRWAAEKAAHAAGKTIQAKWHLGAGTWKDCVHGFPITWSSEFDYRVKPEPDPYRREDFEEHMRRLGYLVVRKEGGDYNTDHWMTWLVALDAARTNKTQPAA